MTSEPTTDRVSSAIQNYSEYSTLASTVTRSLGLSALAIIWLFAGGLDGDDATAQTTLQHIKDSWSLGIPFVAALVALTFDVLQYALASVLWGLYQWAAAAAEAGAATHVKTFNRVYPVLAATGFVSDLEFEAGLKPDKDARKSAIQAALTDPQYDAAVAAVFERADTGRAVTLPSALCFAVKLAALTVTYAALLVYVTFV